MAASRKPNQHQQISYSEDGYEIGITFRNKLRIVVIVLVMLVAVQLWYIADNLNINVKIMKKLSWDFSRHHSGENFAITENVNEANKSIARDVIAALRKKRMDFGMNFRCHEMLSWNEEQILATFKVGKVQRYSLWQSIPDSEYYEMTLDCENFREIGGYYAKPLSRLEADFPIAYSILMYKSAQQVEQLLRTIYMPQNVYCIHVDAKSPRETINAMKYIASCFDNVFIATKLEVVSHCTFSVLKAELNCMSDLLKRKQRWKYYINLCGQDFPLKTNLEIVQILTNLNGKNDIRSIENPNKGRQQYVYEVKRNDLFRKLPLKFKTPPPGNLTVYKGEFHVAMTHNFVHFAVKNTLSKAFQDWLSDTACPDEHFFSTLNRLQEAPGSYPYDVNKDVVREKLWRKRTNSEDIDCRGIFVREICIFTIRDLPWLVKQPKLFANKFHVDFDALATDCLEEMLKNRTEHPEKIDLQYYQNLPHVQDKKH
ncbi:beta-1,3-galactosyl-O-glycosyl-glycoprotein beta-1,6-N-acetylglucosaminyltransferase 3-like [Glandiceps talaboti]